MLSPEQEKQINTKKTALYILKEAYRKIMHKPITEIKYEPALIDFLEMIDKWHAAAMEQAMNAIDSPARRSAHLQAADAYDKVGTYLRDHLS